MLKNQTVVTRRKRQFILCVLARFETPLLEVFECDDGD